MSKLFLVILALASLALAFVACGTRVANDDRAAHWAETSAGPGPALPVATSSHPAGARRRRPGCWA